MTGLYQVGFFAFHEMAENVASGGMADSGGKSGYPLYARTRARVSGYTELVPLNATCATLYLQNGCFLRFCVPSRFGLHHTSAPIEAGIRA